jgi:hypothetical protein
VTASHDGEREDHGPVIGEYLPSRRHEVSREYDHHDEHRETDDEWQPETTEDARDLDEKVGSFDLFLGRAPRDVIWEEVGEESFGQMNGQAAKEKEAASSWETAR